MTTKGFITVATGKWYCYLAQNLVMSYRLFANCNLPFYVITDKKGEKKLKKYFDGVIVVDNPHYDFLDKVDIYKNMPFDETIFLDADAVILKDISYLFNVFSANGSDISCYGRLREISAEIRPEHFGQAAISCFKLKNFIDFNGGIYYFKKSNIADIFFDRIYNDLIPNYDKYEMKYFRVNQKADEPLIGLCMLLYNMKPINTDETLMRLLIQDTRSLTVNLEKQTCSFIYRGGWVSPAILHYGTHNTYSWKYRYYNVLLKHKYKKSIKPLLWIDVFFSFITWIFLPRQLKAFFQWFFAHFKIRWWKNFFKRMNKKLKKGRA